MRSRPTVKADQSKSWSLIHPVRSIQAVTVAHTSLKVSAKTCGPVTMTQKYRIPFMKSPTPKPFTTPVDWLPKKAFWLGDHPVRSEEHTSELQSRGHLVSRLLLEQKIEY